MVLDHDGLFGSMWPVFWDANVFCSSPNCCIVLNQDPIVDHRDSCLRLKFSIGIEFWCDEDHIIGLPFTGRPAGIGQWNQLFVNAAYLSVGVGLVVVVVVILGVGDTPGVFVGVGVIVSVFVTVLVGVGVLVGVSVLVGV